MEKEYQNLNALLQGEQTARSFFMKLPDYVQGGLTQQAFAIHSLENLREKARGMRHLGE